MIKYSIRKRSQNSYKQSNKRKSIKRQSNIGSRRSKFFRKSTSSYQTRVSTKSDIVWENWANTRRKTINFGKSEIIPGVSNSERGSDGHAIDFPNRRSTRGTINQAFIFDELEVVEDDLDEVFDERVSKVSVSQNDFEVTSFRECVKHIYRTQGFISFWNGNLANCLRYMEVAK